MVSSNEDKEEILKTLELFEKYYGSGVNGIYFSKEKMDNLADYMYLFDRLIKNGYPYILNLNSKITNADYDIYGVCKNMDGDLRKSDTFYRLNTLDCTQLLDKCIKFGGVVEHHNEVSAEKAVVTIDIDTTQHKFLVFRDNTREIIQNSLDFHCLLWPWL